MYGLADTKLINVTRNLLLILTLLVRLVNTHLSCYSEQGRIEMCDNDQAFCFTVCNRDETIQGCSWESCQSLLNVFPHVSDCLQCEKDKCNSDPCVDGKVSSWRRENIDKHYIKVKNRSSDCAEGNDSNKFETFDEDCYSEITNRKQNLNNDKIRNNIEKHHYNKDKKGKGIDHIDKEKKNDNKLRDSKNNKNKNSSNKKEAIVVQPCKNKSKVNYEYESTAELKSRPASREFDRHSASVHYKGTNKPVQGSSKGLQELDRSNGPISSSVRCLLIPAYYIRGLSLSALHMVLASQNIMAIKDKESYSQRNSGQMSTLGDAGPSTSNQFDRSSDNVIEESDTMSAGGTGDISVRYKYQYCGDFV
ncbi:hypothetical protein M8J77_011216 [Diaphorina citri]|nr:hypothetical protein M8J77_011216 [Diaphorina citri]